MRLPATNDKLREEADAMPAYAAIRRRIFPSVRAMLTWAPYRFKQRLLMKANMGGVNQCQVVIVDEHHTTMTCGECGHLNRKVGTSKVFQCPSCLSTMPRDWNAARNIFLRFVSTSTWATSLPGLSLGSLTS